MKYYQKNINICFRFTIIFLLFSLLVPFSVKAAEYCAQYNPINVPSKFIPNQVVSVQVNITNCGSITWTKNFNPYIFRLVYFFQSGQTIPRQGWRNLPQDVSPGESISVTLYLSAPYSEGNYTLKWDIEYFSPGGADRTYFSSKGVPTMNQNVVVEKLQLQTLPPGTKLQKPQPPQAITPQEAISPKPQAITIPPISCSIESQEVQFPNVYNPNRYETHQIIWTVQLKNKFQNEIPFVTATISFSHQGFIGSPPPIDPVQKKFSLKPFEAVRFTHKQNTTLCLPGKPKCKPASGTYICGVNVSYPGGEDVRCEKSIQVQ